MPQNVQIRLNVGGTVFNTSLHTVMEGARQGSGVFQCLCVQILGPGAPAEGHGDSRSRSWESRVVPAKTDQYRQEHFVDADPTPFPYWLDYLRSGQVRFVEVGRLREQVRMHLCVFMYMCVCIYMCTCIHV